MEPYLATGEPSQVDQRSPIKLSMVAVISIEYSKIPESMEMLTTTMNARIWKRLGEAEVIWNDSSERIDTWSMFNILEAEGSQGSRTKPRMREPEE